MPLQYTEQVDLLSFLHVTASLPSLLQEKTTEAVENYVHPWLCCLMNTLLDWMHQKTLVTVVEQENDNLKINVTTTTTATRVEARSNTSTVTLRIVRGDEKGSLKSETAPDGARHQDLLAGWPSLTMWLWLGYYWYYYYYYYYCLIF
jgi:hypothetical protein